MIPWLLYFMTCWMPSPDTGGPVQSPWSLWLRLQHASTTLGVDRQWPELTLSPGYERADCFIAGAMEDLAQVCFVSTSALDGAWQPPANFAATQPTPTEWVVARGDPDMVGLVLGQPAPAGSEALPYKLLGRSAPEAWWMRPTVAQDDSWRARARHH